VTTADHERAQPVAAVYRREMLPPSETFVRDHLLRMPRYRTAAVTSSVLPASLPVPGVPVVVPDTRSAAPRAEAAVLRRLGRPPQEVAAPSLAAAVRRTRATLVHAHFGVDAAWALPAVRRTGLPLVVTFHGYDVTVRPDVLARGGAGGRLLVDTFPALVERADAVVTVSEHLRRRLHERGVPAEKTHVIACGVDVASAPAPRPAEPGAPLLFVGRLAPKKGVADLLQALAGVPDAPVLVVAGDGPLRAELEALAARLRVRADFLGMRTSEEVRALMDGAALVCLPSRTAPDGDCEGLPVTALEAGLRGRAVVGYRHSGIPEAVLDGRTGLLAEEGDVAGLRDRLVAALADEGLRQRLGTAARERVAAHFDLDVLLDRLADVYDDVRARRR
jgi:glycosyltransferase involved in cell wall biosynthesis